MNFDGCKVYLSIPIHLPPLILSGSISLCARGRNRSQVCCRAQTSTHTSMHNQTWGQFREAFKLTVVFLDCGKKLVYLERTYTSMWRTCKLQPWAQNILGVRQLLQTAALHSPSLLMICLKKQSFHAFSLDLFDRCGAFLHNAWLGYN